MAGRPDVHRGASMRGLIINALYLEAVIIAAIAIYFSALKLEEKRQLQRSLAIVAVATPILAFFSPNLIVFNLCCFFIIPLVARDRVQVVPLFVFMMVTTPLVSQDLKLGGTFLFRYGVGHSIGLGALVAVVLREGWNGRPLGRWDVPFLAIVLLLWLSNSRDTAISNYAREAVQATLTFIVPYFVVSRGLRRNTDIKLVLVALGAAAIVLSMVCLFETAKTWPIYRSVWSHYGIELGSGASVKLRSGLIRSPGPYPEPLTLSFALTICILALISVRTSIRSRLHFIGLCAIVGLGILAPQARGAWIALLVALFAADMYQGRWRSVSIRAALLSVALVALLGAASVSSKVATIAGLTAEGRGTIDYRKNLLSRGIEEVKKKPLLGDSPVNVTNKMSDLMQGEGIVDFVNGYLYTALISGLIGLATMVLALAGQLWLIVSGRPRRHGNELAYSQLSFAFSAVAATIVMLGNISFGGTTLMLFGFMAAIAGTASAAARRNAKRQRRERDGNIDLPIGAVPG